MKVIHLSFCYWPDAVGGTEVYVRSLAKQQQRQGLDVLIAAPASREEQYSHDGICVRRFPVTQQVKDVKDLYGEGDALASLAFGQILEEERPDLVHLHAFTRGVSLRLVREAKKRGLPVIFSYHTPTVSCQRGTLLRWGSDLCDGVLDVKRCARCALHGQGLNKIASFVAGSIPSGVGRRLGDLHLSGGAWTAARMTELVRVRQDVFRSLMSEVDHIVALCQWVKDLLVRNDVPEGKITVSRQGLDESTDTDESRREKSRTLPIRLAFLGRLDATKGVDVLIKAVALNPELPLRLDVFGVVQGQSEADHLQHLRSLARNDGRISFKPPIPSSEVVARLRDYDLLAVPSQGLETGPRVVLEAFAATVPVLGSNLGGIAELVEHEVNGLLVEPRSIRDWGNTLQSVCKNPDFVTRLSAGIRPVRSVLRVAIEMQKLYTAALRSRANTGNSMATA